MGLISLLYLRKCTMRSSVSYLYVKRELRAILTVWESNSAHGFDKFKQFERVNFFKTLFDKHNSTPAHHWNYIWKLEELSFQMIYGFAILSLTPAERI